MAWPEKIFRSLLLQTLGPGPALDGPDCMRLYASVFKADVTFSVDKFGLMFTVVQFGDLESISFLIDKTFPVCVSSAYIFSHIFRRARAPSASSVSISVPVYGDIGQNSFEDTKSKISLWR